MSKLINIFKRLFTGLFLQNQYKIQTFTYFIPSPKPRNTGYREKQFDKVFYEFINRGYKVIDFKTEQCLSQQETSGIWVIIMVQAINSKAEKLNLDEFGITEQHYENNEVISHTQETYKSNNDQDSSEPFLDLPDSPNDYSDEVQGLYQIKKE